MSAPITRRECTICHMPVLQVYYESHMQIHYSRNSVELAAALVAQDENQVLCPLCRTHIHKSEAKNHQNRCPRRNETALFRIGKDLASGLATWMASGQVIAHYRANRADTTFACGVMVRNHNVVDADKYSECSKCRKALGLHEPDPRKSRYIFIWQGGGIETNRRRH